MKEIFGKVITFCKENIIPIFTIIGTLVLAIIYGLFKINKKEETINKVNIKEHIKDAKEAIKEIKEIDKKEVQIIKDIEENEIDTKNIVENIDTVTNNIINEINNSDNLEENSKSDSEKIKVSVDRINDIVNKLKSKGN